MIIQRELYMDARSIIATDLWMERFIDGIIIYGWNTQLIIQRELYIDAINNSNGFMDGKIY